MSRKLRDHTEVSLTRLVPQTLGRAWFNVALGFILLGCAGWAISAGYQDLTWLSGLTYGLMVLAALTLIPRAIAGLVILRREAAARDR